MGCHFTRKNLEFGNLGKKKKLEKSGIQEILKKTWKILEFLTIFISYVVKFRFKINTLSNR